MSREGTSEVEANLARAHASLDAAAVLLDAGHADFAASRAYYAVFYAASAALLARQLQFRKHGQVLGAIHKHFVKTGLIEARHGRDLNWLFELRALGDYGETRHVDHEEAKRALEVANEIVAALAAHS